MTSRLIPNQLDKTYLLNMPPSGVGLLPQMQIHGVTLANNHSMDFGYQGLFDTLSALHRLRIKVSGAGVDQVSAIKPMTFSTAHGDVCVLAFSRTLPEEFWATELRSGAANLNFTRTAEHIKAVSSKCLFTFVTYHWGAEQSNTAKPYQRKLAKLSIDSGADAVIGHHPHVLQEIEIYEGKPILYSVGNFIFGTRPLYSTQEGLGVRFQLSKNQITFMDLTPLSVKNTVVNFIPQLFEKKEKVDHFNPPRSCKLLTTAPYKKYRCKL